MRLGPANRGKMRMRVLCDVEEDLRRFVRGSLADVHEALDRVDSRPGGGAQDSADQTVSGCSVRGALAAEDRAVSYRRTDWLLAPTVGGLDALCGEEAAQCVALGPKKVEQAAIFFGGLFVLSLGFGSIDEVPGECIQCTGRRRSCVEGGEKTVAYSLRYVALLGRVVDAALVAPAQQVGGAGLVGGRIDAVVHDDAGAHDNAGAVLVDQPGAVVEAARWCELTSRGLFGRSHPQPLRTPVQPLAGLVRSHGASAMHVCDDLLALRGEGMAGGLHRRRERAGGKHRAQLAEHRGHLHEREPTPVVQPRGERFRARPELGARRTKRVEALLLVVIAVNAFFAGLIASDPHHELNIDHLRFTHLDRELLIASFEDHRSAALGAAPREPSRKSAPVPVAQTSDTHGGRGRHTCCAPVSTTAQSAYLKDRHCEALGRTAELVEQLLQLLHPCNQHSVRLAQHRTCLSSSSLEQGNTISNGQPVELPSNARQTSRPHASLFNNIPKEGLQPRSVRSSAQPDGQLGTRGALRSRPGPKCRTGTPPHHPLCDKIEGRSRTDLVLPANEILRWYTYSSFRAHSRNIEVGQLFLNEVAQY